SRTQPARRSRGQASRQRPIPGRGRDAMGRAGKHRANGGAPRTRRRFLLGTAAGAGLVAMETVNPRVARATQGQPVIAGEDNTATGTTSIETSALTGLSVSSEGDYLPAIYGESRS